MNEGEDAISTAVKTGETFWKALLEHIVETGRRTPKSQVERAIGPILGFFLDQAISDLLNSESQGSAAGRKPSDVITLAAEFPLKKKGSNLSTNVDWLMYDKANNELLLVELKTDFTSFCFTQLESYLELAMSASPWEGMEQGFDKICDASRKKSKYQWTKGKRKEAQYDFEKDIANARLRLIYLAPESTRKLFGRATAKFDSARTDLALGETIATFFSFEDLSRCAGGQNGELQGYRAILYDTLRRLDKFEEDVEEPSRAHAANYQERVSLQDMLLKCEGDSFIEVGFTGGEPELKQQDAVRLERRRYKWDQLGRLGRGPRIERNWIKAARFCEIVASIRLRHLRSDQDVDRLALGIKNALLTKPTMTLGQLIARVSSDSVIPLDEMSDQALVEALGTET